MTDGALPISSNSQYVPRSTQYQTRWTQSRIISRDLQYIYVSARPYDVYSQYTVCSWRTSRNLLTIVNLAAGQQFLIMAQSLHAPYNFTVINATPFVWDKTLNDSSNAVQSFEWFPEQLSPGKQISLELLRRRILTNYSGRRYLLRTASFRQPEYDCVLTS